MHRRRRPRPLATGAALVAAALIVVPVAVAANWTKSLAAQTATITSGTLGTPSGLAIAWGTCVANTSFQMNLTWTAATNAKGYQIFRGTASGGPYTQIGTSVGAAYTDAGPQAGPPALTWNTTYYYVVKATAGGWLSAASGEASMRTPKATNCK